MTLCVACRTCGSERRNAEAEKRNHERATGHRGWDPVSSMAPQPEWVRRARERVLVAKDMTGG